MLHLVHSEKEFAGKLNMKNIHKASSKNPDPILAVDEIAVKLNALDCSFAIIFFSSDYDEKAIQQEIKKHFGKNAVAITTAGEISESGEYIKSGISGISFSGPQFKIQPILLRHLKELTTEQKNQINSAIDYVESNTSINGMPTKSFAILLVDGLSGCEENLVEAIGNQIGGIPLVGGSSGDDLKFKKAAMYYDTEVYQNSAMLIFITTSIPFEIFKTQHFDLSEKKLVITESDPSNRIVREINGFPAAKAYAEILGLKETDLNSDVYSQYPLVLKIADDYYVRSIQKSNPDLSLTFYCAIENGLVLSIAKNTNIISTTEKHLNKVASSLGEIECSLLFECILRRLEVLQLDEDSRKSLFKLYGLYNSIGFHTYGELQGSVHINQTLTGVSFGKQ